jgi:protein-S-isoprenylcysteine O-methyltransferase Ste14
MAQRALTGPVRPPTMARAAVATSAAVGAGALAGAAAREFRRRGTTVEPFRPDRASALVTTGANSISRNPMYVGMAGLLVAHAIWRGSWAALAPVAGFIGVIDRLQIRPEESALREKFGTEYADYRAATPRWLDRRSLGRERP